MMGSKMNLTGQIKAIRRGLIRASHLAPDLPGKMQMLEEQNRFLLFELRRINEQLRYQLLGDQSLAEGDREQTRGSFDFQWKELNSGQSLPSDKAFMEGVQEQICKMTDLPASWFHGKKVLDAGCGSGRFTYGLLSLGAKVTASDQSSWGLERTRDLCKEFSDRLTTKQADLLEWDVKENFDLVFSFGVVHHTGNTYLAIRNVARKVGEKGKLFLMIYGFPERIEDFAELNAYEALRHELRNCSLEEKRKTLIERFGESLAHGWFDAVSPRINDLLTYDEIGEVLSILGFKSIKRTLTNRNHHVIAERS
jgi:2-polyprenyl-3-methyl-5-hydroxy-6-metoxy-1,4-benzoquinol methylase